MNFAPYQDESPEVERALSPPLGDANRFKSPILGSPRGSPPIPGAQPGGLPSPSHFAGANQIHDGGQGNHGYGRDVEGGRWNLGAFETSLPIRMDVEAMLAYLLLPPAGGVFLLLLEHKSDYVRYRNAQESIISVHTADIWQVSCLASEHALHSHVYRPSYFLLVELSFLAPVYL
jgi:uncharacterized membrane protein